MEVGAVKQAFNNEIILLKKKLNQAKIQIIHKLTRKAKQLTEKKAPDQLQDKLKRKAESAVKEVLIIKKIKARDIAKFIVTHKGELNSYLNKPQVDQDKAYARLLLHKALQDKYKLIRGRFSNVSIHDLFMSRIERQKMKKEAKEKQKNKKKAKASKLVNSEGDWNVEDVQVADNRNSKDGGDGNISGDEGNDIAMSSEENDDNESGSDKNDQSETDNESDDKIEAEDEKQNGSESDVGYSDSKSIGEEDVGKVVKPITKPLTVKTKAVRHEIEDKPQELAKNIAPKQTVKKNPEKKQKELIKNKTFNEKNLKRKLKIDSDFPVIGNKIVDPFFITSTGENYMSVVEPRAPDEIKEDHKQGNRKLRRAVMFGHVPKVKPRQNNKYYNDDNRFNKQNGFEKGNHFKSKFNDNSQFNDRKSFNSNGFNDKRGFNNSNDRNNDDKPEKLHPSWEAKKKKSGILPFEGKKIVFDDS